LHIVFGINQWQPYFFITKGRSVIWIIHNSLIRTFMECSITLRLLLSPLLYANSLFRVVWLLLWALDLRSLCLTRFRLSWSWTLLVNRRLVSLSQPNWPHRGRPKLTPCHLASPSAAATRSTTSRPRGPTTRSGVDGLIESITTTILGEPSLIELILWWYYILRLWLCFERVFLSSWVTLYVELLPPLLLLVRSYGGLILWMWTPLGEWPMWWLLLYKSWKVYHVDIMLFIRDYPEWLALQIVTLIANHIGLLSFWVDRLSIWVSQFLSLGNAICIASSLHKCQALLVL
jgi:hypothetical protein